MGYDIKIVGENEKISVEQWKAYIDADQEFSHRDSFSFQGPGGRSIMVPTPNSGLWKNGELEVPFTYSVDYGTISVKNADERVIPKMIQIAKQLGAVVKGEEGEIYDEEYLSK